jgi:hypothetical protein
MTEMDHDLPDSLRPIIERLEAQIELHREREAFHAEQEAHHREQRALHAAELETLTSNLAAFKAAAAKAAELARREVVQPPVPSQDVGDTPSLTKMVKRIVEIRAPSAVFGPAAITQEVNQHYGHRLPKRATQKLVSIALRRMYAAGQLRRAREGQPHHETLYAKA